MDLRLQVLQQRYPDLEIDVALVSTQRLSTTSGAVRSTFYNYEALEIVVLTRGRRCVNTTIDASSADRNSTTCTTVFVDDYRYERDIVQTNLVDWYGIISMLRGGAQAYVWVRLILLVYGAYVAAGETPASSSRLLSAVLIVAKIPFQVIVYSSLLPVVGYVAALVLDSSFMDIFFESYWASVGGVVSFKLVPFLKTTTVQMRGQGTMATVSRGFVGFSSALRLP
ncbi:Transcriptional activator Myb [Phytophthora cinnamomi]|uniref:Transcriptional activator Myb n=1 Tax=Phytophthora cinnamomi TaxID=4785 RepID=UPI00355A0389|nr:Transcriptional activator Myb [Phytophthora cinnamomi]